MANFTEAEEELIGRISDENSRLKTNLAKIREVMEDLWSSDPVRIIQHFTDHGVKHSERLVKYAHLILETNTKMDLSDQEIYLLLSGIYLHDIGMQCDIAKFDEIKTKAEELGAKFNIEFVPCDGNYSREMQKAIRKNHQYLTAAWIDFSNRTGKSVLGPAAKEIDPKLVDDLIDICKYHSTFSINECPAYSLHYPTERKQLVAALLRFADELDIEANRVTLETVKNFLIDADNSVFWWMHNRTDINFIKTNVIQINIELHSNDCAKYGPLIQSIFIDEFKKKNAPIIDILCGNGFPIHISSNSTVIENNRLEPLPQDIVQAIKKIKKHENIQASLVVEIKGWLESIGYNVSPPRKFSTRALDMDATLGRGLLQQRVLIRCFEGEIRRSDLEELYKKSEPQKWAIADKRVSPSASEYASSKADLKVFNLANFMREIWGPYFDELTKSIEEQKIPEMYIDLACYKQEMNEQGEEVCRDRYVSLDEYIGEWLKERGKMHISLLGEFGTGKTWFCRHYAYRQLARYLNDPINERLPLLVTLRDFNKAATPQQLINDSLLEKYKLHFVGSAYDVFQKINKEGKLLLILDGFDEMAQKSSYQTIADNFWELTELVVEDSKVILTSRKEYFSWAKESEKILSGKEYGTKKSELSPPEFEIVYLEPFNSDQIKEVIIHRLGTEKGELIAERILKMPNLSEMARKPVLIELLLAALDEVGGDVLENPAQVYLYSTNNLLLRNITSQRTFTTTADKLYFLCELAWEMIRNNKLNMHYKDITERIGDYFKEKIQERDQLDNWNLDLRNQTLLHRNAAGYYEFAHKSLAEYFVAFKFAAELGSLVPIFIQTYKEANNVQCVLPITKKIPSELVNTFGLISIRSPQMKVVSDLLNEMVNEEIAERLWEVIYSTKNKTFDQVKFVGSNAATLLRQRGVSFEKIDLSHTVLVGADLKGCDLSEAKLEGCDLDRADLFGSKFSEDSIKSAKFDIIRISLILIPINSSEKILHEIFREFNSDKMFIRGGYNSRTLFNYKPYIIISAFLKRGFDWATLRNKFLESNEVISIGLFKNEIDEINKNLDYDIYKDFIDDPFNEIGMMWPPNDFFERRHSTIS